MARQLDKSQFSRRLWRLSGLLHLVFHQLGDALKQLNIESRYAIDSFPVALCDNIRIQRYRLTDEFADKEQFRGLVASKRRFLYGVRAQVMVRIEGIPVEFALAARCGVGFEGLGGTAAFSAHWR